MKSAYSNDPFRNKRREGLIKNAADSALVFLQDEGVRLELLIDAIDDMHPEDGNALEETRAEAQRRLIHLRAQVRNI